MPYNNSQVTNHKAVYFANKMADLTACKQSPHYVHWNLRGKVAEWADPPLHCFLTLEKDWLWCCGLAGMCVASEVSDLYSQEVRSWLKLWDSCTNSSRLGRSTEAASVPAVRLTIVEDLVAIVGPAGDLCARLAVSGSLLDSIDPLHSFLNHDLASLLPPTANCLGVVTTEGCCTVALVDIAVSNCLLFSVDSAHLCFQKSRLWSHGKICPHFSQLGASFMFTSCVAGTLQASSANCRV